jgi:hypothetical protein
LRKNIKRSQEVIMPKLEQVVENTKKYQKQRQEHAELIKLYNRLDNQQKTEFKQRLSQVINKPVLSPQVEDYLISLNPDNYDRMFVYTKLLLIS